MKQRLYGTFHNQRTISCAIYYKRPSLMHFDIIYMIVLLNDKLTILAIALECPIWDQNKKF